MLVYVHQDDRGEVGELGPDPGKLLQEALLGDDAAGPGVAQPVQERLLAEVGEERPGDGLQLQGAEEGEELLRHLGQEREEGVPRLEAEPLEDVGEAVRLPLQVKEAVVRLLHVLGNPAHGDLVAAPLVALLAGADVSYVVLVVDDHCWGNLLLTG